MGCYSGQVIAVKIEKDREKSKEIVSRVIKRCNQTGERFGEIIQEEINKLNKEKATKDTGK